MIFEWWETFLKLQASSFWAWSNKVTRFCSHAKRVIWMYTFDSVTLMQREFRGHFEARDALDANTVGNTLHFYEFQTLRTQKWARGQYAETKCFVSPKESSSLFFHNDGQTTYFYGETYDMCKMLLLNWSPSISMRSSFNRRESRIVALLIYHFSNRWNGRRCPTSWAHRPHDFISFLWGCVKYYKIIH